MAASDGLTVTLLGRGGHGSRPHSTIDPVVMAAATVMRLQTIVSREVDPRDVAVVTVGSIHAGLKNNIIPAEAKLELSLRYPDDEARARVLAKVERVVRAEAQASGAEEQPVIEIDHSLPPTINDVACDRAPHASPSTARSARAPSSTRACSPAARTCRGSPASPASRWCSGSGAASTRRRYADATAAGTHRPRHPDEPLAVLRARCSSRPSTAACDALVVAAREFLG